MRRRWLGTVSVVVIVAALLASPLASVGGAQKATGTPIPVTFVNLDATSSTAPARQGARAAVREINRTGGIGGRPIVLTECLTDQTPERGKACMDAAAAAKPAAVLAVQPGTAADFLASLAPAGVPFVAQTCNTNATLSGQFSTYCFGSDFVGLFSSSANYLKTLGTIKRAGLAYINVPAASSGVKAYAVPIFQRAGITPVEIPIPEATTDVATVLTPAFQTAPDALVGLVTGPGCISTMKAHADTRRDEAVRAPRALHRRRRAERCRRGSQGHAVRASDRHDRPEERRREDVREGDETLRELDGSRRPLRAGRIRVRDEPHRLRCVWCPRARRSTPRARPPH